MQSYKERLNLHDAVFTLIDHEDAMVATVYKITPHNLILKICAHADHYLREVYFLQYLAQRLPVPRIVQTAPPEDGLSGAILMECLPGAVLKMEDCTSALAFEMGKLLARIHLNSTNGYGDILYELTLDPRLHFTEKFEEGLAECHSHLPASLIAQCRHYFNKHIDLLLEVDGPCIVHRDFRPGNLIVFNNQLHIIDWAGGRAGFAQEDFCPLEHGEWPSYSKAAFLEGYGTVRKVPDYSAMMPLLRLSKAVATIGFTVKRETWEGVHQRLYQWNRRFLESL